MSGGGGSTQTVRCTAAPFYTHPQPDDTRWTNSFDLLFRGLELVTGGQRLHHYAHYEASPKARGQTTAPYVSYLHAFRHGMPPHGGFAIGLERWVARLMGADNVRQTTLFPPRPSPDRTVVFPGSPDKDRRSLIGNYAEIAAGRAPDPWRPGRARLK